MGNAGSVSVGGLMKTLGFSLGLMLAGLLMFWMSRIQGRINSKLYSKNVAWFRTLMGNVFGNIIGGILFLLGVYGVLYSLGLIQN
jgi:hypothetical protein